MQGRLLTSLERYIDPRRVETGGDFSERVAKSNRGVSTGIVKRVGRWAHASMGDAHVACLPLSEVEVTQQTKAEPRCGAILSSWHLRAEIGGDVNAGELQNIVHCQILCVVGRSGPENQMSASENLDKTVILTIKQYAVTIENETDSSGKDFCEAIRQWSRSTGSFRIVIHSASD